MYKILSFIFILLVLSSSAQSSFEGMIEMKMSTGDKPDMGRTKMYFSKLGGRTETEMQISPNLKPFKTVRIYKQGNPNLFYVINNDNESYSITDLSAFKPSEKEAAQVN